MANNQHLAYFQGMYNEMVLKQGGNLVQASNEGHPQMAKGGQ